MKLSLLTTTTTSTTATLTPRTPPLPFLGLPTPHPNHYSLSFPKTHHPSRPTSLLPLFFSNPAKRSNPTNGFSSSSNLELGGMPNDSLGVVGGQEGELEGNFSVQVGNPVSPSFLQSKTAKLSLSDQAFFLLAFIACTTSVAFTSLVVAAVPTLYAMGRAATSLSKLADTACEELPSTMAAIRLSGMEISDLTLELSDLSQEITEGVNKSAQAVQAAEAGIRQMGALARHHTISMIQERASLPIVSLQPVVAGAAKKTSRAVGQATKSLINMISGGELSSEDDNDNGIDGVDI